MAVAVVFVLAVTLASPAQNVTKFGPVSVSWSGLLSWLSVPRLWASPVNPHTPQQQSGTAAGRGHRASSASTKAGGGAGHPKGKGKDEQPAYVPYARKFTAGQSAGGLRGFDPKSSVRVSSKSSATMTYFSNPDGSYTRKYAEQPVNYRAAVGDWQPIDTTIQAGTGGRWREKANSLGVQFAAAADDPSLASVALDGTHSLSYGLAGAAHVAGTVSGSTITYAGALPGTDVKLSPTALGEKEALVLHSAQAASSWTFPLNLTGLSVAPAPGGGINLLDVTGRTVGVIPPGEAYDSKVNRVSGEPATTHAVTYKLSTVDGKTSLAVGLDPAWLHDPARVFPVTVDPSTMSAQALTTYAETGASWVGDHSSDIVVKVGSYDAGPDSANSFMSFPGLGIDGSHVTVSAAELDIFDTWASYCSPERFDVAPITQPWTPSTVTTYPGPAMGASIGNASPSVPNACKNTGADRSVGDWVTVPLTVATFNQWAAGTTADYGLGMYASTADTLHWKQFGSVMSQTGGPQLELTYSGVLLPQILTQSPANGTAMNTLTPLLSAEGTTDLYLVVNPKYDYQVFNSAGSKVVDSGLVTGAWAVPPGKLQWGQAYYWEVQAYDGVNYSPNPPWFELSTQVPQPPVTSTLSQNSNGHGFDPSIGNYTTSSTDADVATVGPALSVVRNYNSRDPRSTGALGAAWSSVFDARAVERYDPTNSNAVISVVVTYPDGSEVGFGRNADGTFTAPAGRAATLIRLASGYELIDKADTTYTFTQALGSGTYGIASIADANTRTETFTWASGQISTMTSTVSGRALHLTWATPAGAGSAHVSTVATDPLTTGQPSSAYVWTYGYSGDQLTSVCPPGSSTQCTRYGYDAHPASQSRNQTLDDGAASYWPLAEPAGSTVAHSAIVTNEGADNATYTGVGLGSTPGPLASSAATAASFDGSTAQVLLPDLKMSSSIAQSMSLWFNAPVGAPAGVLFSYSDMAMSATAKSGNNEPTIYLGTDGKLLGEYWITGSGYVPNPIKTSASVADGHWHHVVLTGSQTAQSMYLDGALVGTIAGWGASPMEDTMPWQWHFNYLGVGFLGEADTGGGLWPDQPHTSEDTIYATYFKGAMADASFYNRVLTASDASALHNAGLHPDTLLTSVTRPSGKAYSAVTYDPVSAAATHVTDENGGSWTLGAPSVTGSSQVYRSSVLGAGPQAYYRLGDTAGAAQAYSEVRYPSATYGGATLGVAGPFSDNSAAGFNGTSSSMRLPDGMANGAAPQSISLWFNTTHPSGVLFGYSQAALSAGSTTGNYIPALYVGTDGKLKGEFWQIPQITSAAAVTDGKWHQVVLATSGTSDSMYLDGELVATTTGTMNSPQSFGMNTDYIGTGFIGGSWGDNPHSGVNAATPLYFNGSIAEVSYYRSQLSTGQVSTQFSAARNSVGLTPMTTVHVTDPGNKTLTYQYDPVNGNREIAQIDGLGNKTSYGYDTSGFLYTTTDPDGDVTTTGHDTDGNVVSKTTCQNQSTNTCSTAYATYKPNVMGQDQAKGATVTASSTYSADGWTAVSLVDGNTASVAGAMGWTTNGFTSSATTAWVQADMGSARVIDQVSLYPVNTPTTVGNGFPQAFTVAVSANGTTWTTVTTQTNYPQPTTPAPASFGFAPTSVRYVKVTGTTLRTDGSKNFFMQFAELAAVYDRSDPTAGELLTQRDARSASATDNTYLTSYGYDAVGDLATVTGPPVPGFPSGRTTTLSYTDGTTVAATDTGFAPAGLPYRTTSPGGAVNTVRYLHNGDVAGSTDADGLVTGYGYDALGRASTRTVVSSSFPSGLTTSYGYDGQDRVVSETDPPITNRVTGATHTASTTTGYDADGNVVSQEVDDTTGGDASRTQTTTFNANDQVASSTDAAGDTTSFSYDGYGNKASETNPDGNQIQYTYDADGHLLTQVLAGYIGDPVSPQSPSALTEESRSYDPAGRLQSVTNAMGDTTSYTYTDDGLAATATRTDAHGANPFVLKSDGYDAAGNLIQEVTNNGATTTRYSVDAASRQSAVTLDPTGLNRTTTVSYTPDDEVATSTTSDATGATQTTTATYDPMGQVTSRSVGNLTTSWTLDQRGLPTSMTDPDGNTTGYAYDEAGRRAVTTAPTVDAEVGGGAAVPVHPVSTTGYDTFGEAVETDDPDGNVTTIGYDAAGRAVSQTMPDYLAPGSSTPITATATKTYDPAGNLIRVTDPLSHSTNYRYDQMGDVATVTAADGGVTHYTYDPNGETLSMTDPMGAQTQATYDDMGRQLTASVVDRYPGTTVATTMNSYAASTSDPHGAWLASSTTPDGSVTTYGYDAFGETTSVTDAAGNTSGYRYDFLGRRTATVAPDGTSTTVAYDPLGDPVSTKNLDASGTVLTTRSAGYSGDGNLLSSTDARGDTTTFTYDATGLMTQEVQPVSAASAITTSFGYDAAGNRTRFTDGRHNSWIYTYNSWSQPESVIEPATAAYSSAADRTTTTTYDADGREASQTLPGGVTLSTGYDAMGHPVTQSGSGADAATATRTFGYDLDGRVTSAATNAAGAAPASAESFSYNDRGELLTATGSAGSSSFVYSSDGLMADRTDASGTTSYIYDTDDRVKTLQDAATGTVITYAYNALSQVSSMRYGTGGDTRSLGYDNLHRLTSDVLTTTGGAQVASIGYGYDGNGNETSKTTTGFTGSTTNTYTYDQADRLTSWNNGTATTDYGYDASGNRVQVGANVYTYDARDELTGDGTNTYQYTARGTLSRQNTATSTSDAYGQAITQGTQTYSYDALGRTLTASPGTGSATTLSYSGTDNTVAADFGHTYTRDPGGGLVGIGTVGGSADTAVLAYTDAHTDVVGDFTASGGALAGSTAYDPLGNVLSTVDRAGQLGYQSGWTDGATGAVNMAARWYNPAVGQFTNRDTIAQNPVPNSAAANPFAYVDDNPMDGTDPSGHGWLSSAWHAATHVVSTVWHATTAAASWVWNKATSAADDLFSAAEHAYQTTIKKINDAFNREMAQLNAELKKLEAQIKAINNDIKQKAQAAQHLVTTTYHAVAAGAKATGDFLKNHAAAIGSFVVSTAVFMGCEAVLGAATGGVGAVAGAVACGALSGAVGGLFNQGAKCLSGAKGGCSAGAFLKAGVIGGAVGGLSGLGGALGGKLLSALGGRALSAIGGLFGRGAADLAEGAATDAATSAGEGAVESSADSAATSATEDASDAATSATDDASAAHEPGDEPADEPSSDEDSAASCKTSSAPHSFTGSTPVLLADGTSKPIAQIKVGDKVADSAPGQQSTQTHTVQNVIVTTTDHDFVDVTVKPASGRSAVKGLAKVAAGLAVAATALVPAQGGTLTTTFHHAFYDETQAAFVEAAHLRVGDELQTPSGTATITSLHLYHADTTTYDLTIDGLHTYYVVAGDTPVLVHNCGESGQVAYGGTDLSREALAARVLDNNKRNLYAVARYADADGKIQTLAVNSDAEGHAEENLVPRLAELGVSPSDVTDLFVEFKPCNGTINCEANILPKFDHPDFKLTYSFDWNTETEVQNAARKGLSDALNDLWPGK